MGPMLGIEYFSAYYSSAQNTFQAFLQTDLVKRVADIAILIFSKMAILYSFPDQSKELNHKFIALIGLLTVIGLVLIAIFGRNQKSILDTPITKKLRPPEY